MDDQVARRDGESRRTISVAALAAVVAVSAVLMGPGAGTAAHASSPAGRAGSSATAVADRPHTPPGHGAVLTVPIADYPSAVRVSHDQRFAFIPAAGDDVVSIVNLCSGALVKNLTVGAKPMDLAFNASGRTAYVPNEIDGTLSVIDTKTQSVTGTLPVGGHPTGVAVRTTRRGDQIFVADFGSSLVRLVLPGTGVTTRSWPVDYPAGVVATANGTIVAPSSEDGSVLAIDAGTLTSKILSRPDQTPTNLGSVSVYRNTVVLPGDITTWLDTTTNTFNGKLAAIAPFVTSGSSVLRGGAYTVLTTRDYEDDVPVAPGVLSLVRNSDHSTVSTLPIGVGAAGVTASRRGLLVIQGPADNGQFDLLIVPNSSLSTR